MSDYIPHEIIVEILTKLPVESLIRFTVVSKSWYSLITNPTFISIQLNHALCANNQTLLLRYYATNDMKENYTILRDDDDGTQLADLPLDQLGFPFNETPIGYLRIVGSSHGLLCLSDDMFGDKENVFLWNPSIRKSVMLPVSSKPRYPHMFVLGFGVCPVTGDYKVVKIVYRKDLESNSFVGPPEVEVYSLGMGFWRRGNGGAPRGFMLEFTWSQAFVFGAVHWIAYVRGEGGGSRNFVASFDMGDEVFREVMLPSTLTDKLVSNLSINIVGESLSVLDYNKESGRESCCVWIMKEYGVYESWSKVFTISLPGTLRRAIWFRKNGEVILALNHGGLVSYDPNTKQIKGLGIQGNIRSLYIGGYVKTLVLLQGQHCIREGLAIPVDTDAGESAVEGSSSVGSRA